MTLHEARTLLGWSQSELARRAGEIHSNIRDLENGSIARPSHALVTRVMRALHAGGLRGVKTEDLFPVGPRGAAPADAQEP